MNDDVKNWRDKPVSDLKVPQITKKVLGDRELKTFGDVWNALERADDIGLGVLQEKVRGQIDDAKTAAGDVASVDLGDKTLPLTNGEAIDADPLGLAADVPSIPEAAAVPEPVPISEAVDEVVNNVVESAKVACPNCSNTGVVGESDTCPVCNGSGLVAASEAKRLVAPNVEPSKIDEHLLLQQIQDAQREIDEQEEKIAAMKEDLKDENKELEALQLGLAKLIRQSKADQQPNLFNQPPEAGDCEEQEGPTKDQEPASKLTEAENSELWRQFPLERFTQFGLAKSVIAKLAEASPPILTQGDLADYSKPGPTGWTKPLVDIPGIGKGKAEKIEDAGIKFWAWWGAGGQVEFAKEKGLTNGNDSPAGTGNENPPTIDPGETLADDWSEPGGKERAAA
jgi:hypothetical protein